MTSRLIGVIAAALLLVGAGCAARPSAAPPADEFTANRPNPLMKIESSAFGMNEAIPSDYACDGRDVNPPLRLIGVPAEAQSLALIVDDPDASLGTWVHWVVWNIAPDTAEIAAGSVPAGASEGVTDLGRPGYGGPCPPSGAHRYFFKVFALDAMLDLPATADAAALESAMIGHVLDKAGLVGIYSRR